jgi:type I restriction enzyme S subunit
LRCTQANLKRYRAAVLKAACEGRLVPTEAELAKLERRRSKIESGEERLARVLTERRQNWRNRGKYKEPVTPDVTNLQPLPAGWTWSTVDQLCSLVTDGDHNPPKRHETGLPHLTAKNVRNWRLDATDCTFISTLDAERVLKRYDPVAGDLIVTCVGTVGRTAIVPAEFKFSPDRNLAAVRLVERGTSTRYLNFVLSSPKHQELIRGASGSTAQPHLYLGDLRAIAVPLPPLAEQTRIVAEVERRLSVVEELETVVNANLQRAARLRQSLLRRAFTAPA